MARYTPLFYRGAPASIPQVVAHLQKAMSEEDPDYTPLRQRMPPASIPDIVAHIQKYLTENVFVTIEDLGEDIAAYIEAHPDIVGVLTVNGSSGNVALDASDIPIETGEDPTVAGAISYLSSQLALLVADAVLSVNGVTPDDSHNVTLTGAEIPQDGNTTKKLSETFGPASASAAGSKGLVPAPAAGDENKVLSGAGTWVVNQSAGGVSSVCNVEPNAQGNVPLKGSDIPLQSMSLQTVAQAIAAASTTFTGATSQAAGAKGQVPAPAAGDEDKVLSGGGTWVTPASGTVKQVCSVSPDAQGNVALTGSAVPTSTTDSTPISSTLSTLNDQKAEKGDLTNLKLTGTTNSTGSTIYRHTIFYLNGVLCIAIADIADGATFTSSNYETLPNGGFNAVPYFISTFTRLNNTIPIDGTNTAFEAPEDGYYALLAVNSNVTGKCHAYFVNSSISTFYSASVSPEGSYTRASTAFIPLKKGTTIYARAFCTSEAYIIQGK